MLEAIERRRNDDSNLVPDGGGGSPGLTSGEKAAIGVLVSGRLGLGFGGGWGGGPLDTGRLGATAGVAVREACRSGVRDDR